MTYAPCIGGPHTASQASVYSELTPVREPNTLTDKNNPHASGRPAGTAHQGVSFFRGTCFGSRIGFRRICHVAQPRIS